jgi:hypothetical protein
MENEHFIDKISNTATFMAGDLALGVGLLTMWLTYNANGGFTQPIQDTICMLPIGLIV